jgi:hypothetical protein
MVQAVRRVSASWPRHLVAVLVLAGFMVSLPAPAGASNPLIRPHQFAPAGLQRGAQALGALPGTQQLSLSVVLPPSDSAGVQSLLANLYDPSSPQYHQWLKPGQFATEFGPAPSDVASVESWLHSRGLRSTSRTGADINVTASVKAVSAALGTSFERYRSPSGHEGFVTHDTPLVPQNLAGGQIASIVGLNTLSTYQPEDLKEQPSSQTTSDGGDGGSLQPAADGLTPCPSATNALAQFGGGASLDQVGSAYGINNLLHQGENGQGETVALYELAPHSASDVNTYLNCFGLTNSVTTDPVLGGGVAAGNQGGVIEADLDIEQVATQAPKANIISYEGPNSNLGALLVWQDIVSADAAQVVSTSWGECESIALGAGGLGGFSDLFTQAAAQGQSIFAATGDAGSEDCWPSEGSTALAVDYPASDPGVTAVGGTTLTAGSEVAWNDCQFDEFTACGESATTGAGGGGVSDDEPRPNYQPVIDPAEAFCGGGCREVPDVSANSGTPMLIHSGSWGFATGTSFAAPFWAGLAADKNVGCTAQAGLFSPSLYALYGTNGQGAYGTGFNDITNGNNDLLGMAFGQFSAMPGYDLATGIGSPIAAGLSCPEVTSVTQGDIGQDVVISGLGLAHATFEFGSSAATVVSATDTQATVMVPVGNGNVTVTGSSPLGTGVATSTFTYPPPSITTTSLAIGAAGAKYSQQLSAVGGAAPYSWSTAPGALPAGLSLDSTSGLIAGTPAGTSSQSVTFTVTDKFGVSGSSTLQLTVRLASATTITGVPPSTVSGATVTYSASVSSGSAVPTGSVAVTVGATALCTSPLLAAAPADTATGSCTSAAAPVGADTVSATYSGDPNFAPSTDTTSEVVTSGPYTAMAPVRICDTRPVSTFSPSNQCSGATIGAGLTKSISVASELGVPSDATSVVLNVTAVNPAAPGGFMTVYPSGTNVPTASNLNYLTGETVANLVQVGVGTGGDVLFFSSVRTDLVVDVEGYTSPNGVALYAALPSPSRLCDTRTVSSFTPANQCNGPGNVAGTLLAPGVKNVQVTNNGTIPNGATAAVLNVTAVNPGASGFLTVFPEGQKEPVASNVNFGAGQTTTNRVIVPIPAGGGISIASSAPTDLVVDISGYYTAASGAQFSAEPSPVRICDSRPMSAFSPTNQCTGMPINPGASRVINVSGLANVPSGATAVVVNVTGVGPTQPTFLTVFSAGTPVPNVSDLNLATGETRANLDVATLSAANGKIAILNQTGSLNVIVDVLGWYS